MGPSVLVLASVALLLAGCGDGRGARTSAGTGAATTPTPAPNFTLSATRRCLAAHGATVTNVRPTDSRLKAFRDLAQRNSLEAGTARGSVAIAFATSDGNAELLAELLRVPKDSYRIVVRRNVVLYARKRSRAVTTGLACLRR